MVKLIILAKSDQREVKEWLPIIDVNYFYFINPINIIALTEYNKSKCFSVQLGILFLWNYITIIYVLNRKLLGHEAFPEHLIWLVLGGRGAIFFSLLNLLFWLYYGGIPRPTPPSCLEVVKKFLVRWLVSGGGGWVTYFSVQLWTSWTMIISGSSQILFLRPASEINTSLYMFLTPGELGN